VNNNPFSVYMLRDSGIDWGQVRQDDSYKPAGKNTGLQERVATARSHYLEHHGKVKALSGLMDRLDHEHDQQADKELQKQSDEWANRVAFQNSRSNQK